MNAQKEPILSISNPNHPDAGYQKLMYALADKISDLKSQDLWEATIILRRASDRLIEIAHDLGVIERKIKEATSAT